METIGWFIDITTEEAIAYAMDPRNDRPTDVGQWTVMAANYDQDCPNYDEHDADGTCHCWDGITADDVDTYTNEDGIVDLELFALWGPFAIWGEGAKPTAPLAPDTEL